MLYELILLCSSINGAITAKLEVAHMDGSDDCSKDALCKSNPVDGFFCKVAGGNQDVTVTNCEALNVHYTQWSSKDIIKRISLDALSQIQQPISTVHNATRANSEEVDTVKGRLAVAAVLSFTQLAIVLVYLITIGVMYIKKCVEKHQAQQMETNLQAMEAELEERKTKRRTTASRAKSISSPTQEYFSVV